MKTKKQQANTGQYGDPLTPRQTEVLRLVCAGNSSKEIAADLKVSDRTVEAYRLAIRTRLLPDPSRYTNESLGVVAERMGLLKGVEFRGAKA
jgi:DNA-binding NarL/FixJ family response regulator